MIKSLKNKKLNQTIFLFSATILAIFINLITNIIVSNSLGPEGFGDYRFIITILSMFTTVFSLGFYQAVGRLVVLSNNIHDIRQFLGASLLITFVLYLVISLTLYIYFLLDNNINNKGLFSFVYIAITFGWVFLIKNLIEITLPSSNQIALLSLSRVLQPLLLLISITLFVYYDLLNINFSNVKLVLLLTFLSFFIIYSFVLIRLRVSFRRLKYRVIEVIKMNKTFGFNVYIGGLMPLVVASLSEILISYHGTDNSGVGFYSLAVSLCSVIALVPRIIGSVAYKGFASQDKIPVKILLTSSLLSLACLISLITLVKPFILFFYGDNFSSVVNLSYILSVGVFFHGMADLLNRYMGAHGRGRLLRNSAILVGLCLLILNVILIPKYQEYGAVTAASISGIIYFCAMYLSYRKSTL